MYICIYVYIYIYISILYRLWPLEYLLLLAELEELPWVTNCRQKHAVRANAISEGEGALVDEGDVRCEEEEGEE